MDKKKILVFIDWYLPGYKAGGPIRSVSNIITSLKNNFDFFVFTRNTDLGDSTPYSEIESDKWIMHPGNYQVYYASRKSLSLKTIYRIISERDYDILYLNGIFSFRFNILPLFISRIFFKNKFRIIVSPRGMLGGGALSLKKMKKKVFLFHSRIFGLFRKVTWHASTGHEAKEISDVFGNHIDIVNAMNISLPPEKISLNKYKEKGEAKFFFISRVSPKKNLMGTLKILKEVKTGMVYLDIFGPVEDDAYWKECKFFAKSLAKNISVNYKGILPPESNQNTLSTYHFLLFPTLNENYGHVIYESLSAGCPVIISDQTPWKNLEKKGIGWDIPLEEKERFIRTVETCIGMGQEEYNILSENAQNFALEIANNQETIVQNRRLFSIS